MIETFSPKWFYINKLDDKNQKEVNNLFKKFIKNDNNFGQPSGWNCNVKTSFQHPNNIQAPWDQFLDITKPRFNEFLNEIGFHKNAEIQTKEIWANKYRRGDSQEYHTHSTCDCNLSMVYFHTVNEDDHCKFVFYNNDRDNYQLSGLSDVLSIPNAHCEPIIEQGGILIFPSFYPHLVSPHRGRRERITFSANFNIRAKKI